MVIYSLGEFSGVAVLAVDFGDLHCDGAVAKFPHEHTFGFTTSSNNPSPQMGSNEPPPPK